MPRFSANLTLLFTELGVLKRFQAAADAGFTGAEFLFPYDVKVADLAKACGDAGLDWVLMNCPPPNWAGGPRGFAAVPDHQDRFRRDFERSMRVAEALNSTHLHIMSGKASGPQAYDTMVENLIWAADRAPHISLTIEPINQDHMPGYFLSDFGLAMDILDAVNAPNLAMQFDAYHAQVITGDMMACWDQVRRRVRHIQIAGWPGRHEPNRGRLDYPAFFDRLDADGYKGWVSAEYNPHFRTDGGLDWLPKG
ncbi:hydroxypyruvate isomerase family protein [Paracoccus sp. (in: a-proteobacteria)]|uniref:hydroxypyruvate isomerase family protein n=1 Tax=Paracoccus sp. TaxID=267 RepID=UPI0026E0B884|nr:TIM barrel protein [Paracoccus sp. (in: a-proteobacteria)]MDO5647397.1 TIM barrel protein [Paracoccus sp. (in: a-proteobacteria)]